MFKKEISVGSFQSLDTSQTFTSKKRGSEETAERDPQQPESHFCTHVPTRQMPGWNIIHAALERAASWSSVFPCHTPIKRIPQIWGELRSGTPTDRTVHLTVKPGSQRYSRVIWARWFQLRGCKTNLRLTGFKLEDANQLSVDRSVSSLFSLVECQQGQVR